MIIDFNINLFLLIIFQLFLSSATFRELYRNFKDLKDMVDNAERQYYWEIKQQMISTRRLKLQKEKNRKMYLHNVKLMSFTIVYKLCKF